eukprot:1139293-Pelagomonas_calceolata.AAC.14
MRAHASVCLKAAKKIHAWKQRHQILRRQASQHNGHSVQCVLFGACIHTASKTCIGTVQLCDIARALPHKMACGIAMSGWDKGPWATSKG